MQNAHKYNTTYNLHMKIDETFKSKFENYFFIRCICVVHRCHGRSSFLCVYLFENANCCSFIIQFGFEWILWPHTKLVHKFLRLSGWTNVSDTTKALQIELSFVWHVRVLFYCILINFLSQSSLSLLLLIRNNSYITIPSKFIKRTVFTLKNEIKAKTKCWHCKANWQ